MLDKIAAVELFNYIKNAIEIAEIEDLSIQSIVRYSKLYCVEQCETDCNSGEVFSPETIAYCYGRIQGLN
jgi:hypothetical protein